MTFIERNEKLVTVVLIVFVFVVAAIPMEPEDMELYQGPPRLFDVLIPILLLLVVGWCQYKHVPIKEVDESI